MKYELKDWLNSINFSKQDLTADDPSAISSYPPYIVNRCLSGAVDSVLFANEINMNAHACLLYTSPSPRDRSISRMPSSA